MNVDPSTIQHRVTSVQRRMLVLRVLSVCVRGAMAGALLAVPLMLIAASMGLANLGTVVGAVVFLLGLALALAFSRPRRASLYRVAKLIDDKLGLGDRVSSGLHFARRPEIGGAMARLLVADAATAAQGIDPDEVVDGSARHRLAGIAAMLLAVLVTSLWTLREGPQEPLDPTQTELQIQTRRLAKQQVELEALLQLATDDQSDEVQEELARIRKLIQDLQASGENMSRKEILARLSREIKELEASKHKGNIVLSRALEQLKVSKEAIARGDFLAEQAEMLERTHEDLLVRGEDGEIVGEAEKIKAAVLTDEERQQREAMEQEMKGLAKERTQPVGGEDEAGVDWVATVEEQVHDDEGRKRIKKTEKVAATYDELMLAAGRKDVREMLTRAAADRARSSSEYREVYTNFKRVLEELLPTKDMPIGQKEYVRRYFRLIKPRR